MIAGPIYRGGKTPESGASSVGSSSSTMSVNFNEPKRSYLRHQDEIDAAIARVLDSGYYIFGEEVLNFERQFADYCGVAHCIGVASGTDALLIALLAADVGPGSEVITAGNAGGYASVSCMLIGAVPVYVDVEPQTLVLDPARVAAAITDRTRVIIATHLYGNMVDMQPLQSLADEHGIMLVEDCAQAHGAERDGQRAGSCGDIGIFSFYPTKNLGALGDGGVLVCSDDDLACKIRELRQYGWREKYTIERPYGVNSRLDPIQAAVLAVKLPYLDAANERRRQIVKSYQAALDGSNLRFCHRIDASYAAHLCVLRHPQRDAIRTALGNARIGTDIHYPVPDFDQPGLQKMKFRKQSVPVSQQACREIFSLPLYAELTDAEVAEVCTVLGNLPQVNG